MAQSVMMMGVLLLEQAARHDARLTATLIPKRTVPKSRIYNEHLYRVLCLLGRSGYLFCLLHIAASKTGVQPSVMDQEMTWYVDGPEAPAVT